MELHDQTQTILNLIQRSAFQVQQGVITHVNSAAARYLLQPGMEIAPLLATGQEEYAEFQNGCLYLTLQLEGFRFGATVVRMDETDIFALEESNDVAQLRTLSLAAMELRTPLSGAMATTDRLLPMLSAQKQVELQEYAAQLNRRLMQLQRIIGNMSDCAGFGNATSRSMEYVQICSLFEEQLAKVAEALRHANLQLEYSVPSESIYTLCNPQKLERAVYNMLSNAAKHTPSGSTIQAQLRRNGNRLVFSVTNPGGSVAADGNIFTRYLREPGLESSLEGIGLGMAMIRSAALVHGGAVLMDHPDGCTRVSMTLQITQSKSTEVHSNLVRFDYAGERDHCLLELSDILPISLYRADNEK